MTTRLLMDYFLWSVGLVVLSEARTLRNRSHGMAEAMVAFWGSNRRCCRNSRISGVRHLGGCTGCRRDPTEQSFAKSEDTAKEPRDKLVTPTTFSITST